MLVWCGPWTATPKEIMKGMGMRPTVATAKAPAKSVATTKSTRTSPRRVYPAPPPTKRVKAPAKVTKTRVTGKPAPKRPVRSTRTTRTRKSS